MALSRLGLLNTKSTISMNYLWDFCKRGENLGIVWKVERDDSIWMHFVRSN